MRRLGVTGTALMLILAGCGGGQDRLRGSDLPGRIGPPYRINGRTYVPKDDRTYNKVGIASWYGAEQRGARTASGERFDPRGISAAHRTLPLPSYVEVTALDTGRRLVVRINDRGPFAGDRLIDLSQGAARKLRVERAGTARVRVRRVFPGETTDRELPAPVPAAAPAPLPIPSPIPPFAPAPPPVPAIIAAADPWFVQVAIFPDADPARVVARSMEGEVSPADGLFRVRLGPFADLANAQAALARARAAGYQNAMLVRDAAPPNGFMDPE